MSQFGMQMPGGKAKRGSTLDVYTVLAFLAVVALAAACVVMYFAAMKVAPADAGHPFAVHEKGQPIRLAVDKR